jgi:hypothetical protein
MTAVAVVGTVWELVEAIGGDKLGMTTTGLGDD